MSRELKLFIATSLDGYIATREGNIDFLSIVEAPPEDYGYSDFIETIDTIVIGRKTYEKVLSFGSPFWYGGKKCYVVTRTLTGKTDDVEFYNGSVVELVTKLKQQEGKHIFCDGGAELIFELMKHELIDEYTISILPIVLGNGIHLFKEGFNEQRLHYIGSKAYSNTGLLQIKYRK